jgi:hypothetical protein
MTFAGARLSDGRLVSFELPRATCPEVRFTPVCPGERPLIYSKTRTSTKSIRKPRTPGTSSVVGIPKRLAGSKLPELDVLLTGIVSGKTVVTAVGTSVAKSSGVGVSVGVWVGVGVAVLPDRGCAPERAGLAFPAALTAEARTKSMPFARKNASSKTSKERHWMCKGRCMIGPSFSFLVLLPSW